MTVPKLKPSLQKLEKSPIKGANTVQIARKDILRMFVHAALKTLSIQCSFEAKPRPSFVKGSKEVEKFDIAALVAIVSPSFMGSLVICFPEKTFLAIMTGMLGSPQTAMTDDLKDGSKELVNIIFGAAKKEITDAGYQLDRAIPKLISPEDVNQIKVGSAPHVVIPFHSSEGGFHIEVAFDLID